MFLSNVWHKNKDAWKSDKKFIVNAGGSSSSKTFSVLQLLVWIAEKYELKIDIVSESVPHLKQGVITDMVNVCNCFNINFDENYIASERKYQGAKGTINFLAFDKLGKSHGGRRDILYLNEANHLNWAICEQLIMRTRQKIFIDYNPTAKFWVYPEFIEHPINKANTEFIHSTYKDNERLEQSIVDYLESKKGDNNFWRVYGLGEIGVSEGLVFNNFSQKDFDKDSFSRYYYGIDWGFSKDPFTFGELAIEGNDLYICREIYKTGLLNKDSSKLVKPLLGRNMVICDSSEPKSIAEYRSFGINATGAKKGKGSIESGIKKLQEFDNIYIHTDCVNAYDEFSNYHWLKDKMGKELPKPTDDFNHYIDLCRYALEPVMNYTQTKLSGRRFI